MERQGRRCKQLLDDLKERKGYLNLKEDALDLSRCRSRFERGYGLMVTSTKM